MAEQQKPNAESRVLAALAHGSVVATGLGVLVGVMVYLNQRGKSLYAAFQALQAAVYQGLSLVIIGAVWMLWGIFYALTFIPLIQHPELYEDAPPPIFWIGLGSLLIPLVVMFVIVLIGLWGAVRTLQGKEFRYPVVGRLLERAGLWSDDE